MDAPSSDDPVSAFVELRGEVSLLRRAIEGLTAERQSMPDYTPTLTAISQRLAKVEGAMGEIASSPALRLTPETLAASLVKASEIARAGDRETIDKASAGLRAAVASISGLVEQAWKADRQWKQLYWTAGGSFILGVLGAVSLLQMIG